MRGSDAGGVSRKIEDGLMRKNLRSLAAQIVRPDGCGFIIRTAGLGRTRAEIQKDLDGCLAIHERMTRAAGIARAPSLLHSELDLVARTLRDLFSDEIDEVWIDSREEFEAAASYFDDVMPDARERLFRFDNPIPIFSYFRVEEQIEATYERRVSLPSGGSIVIDETEALVAIDVNSGKTTSEKGHEETVFKTNREAAEEAARQMKLRDLGGIVVIDFIDMELEKNRRAVEKSLAEHRNSTGTLQDPRINSKGCAFSRVSAFGRGCAVHFSGDARCARGRDANARGAFLFLAPARRRDSRRAAWARRAWSRIAKPPVLAQSKARRARGTRTPTFVRDRG